MAGRFGLPSEPFLRVPSEFLPGRGGRALPPGFFEDARFLDSAMAGAYSSQRLGRLDRIRWTVASASDIGGGSGIGCPSS